MVITTNQLLGRDNDGNIVPVEHTIEGLGAVMVSPLTRGEFLTIRTNLQSGVMSYDEVDAEHISKHLHFPVITRAQIDDIPLPIKAKIVKAILVVSGIAVEENKVADAVKEAEDEIRKKAV